MNASGKYWKHALPVAILVCAALILIALHILPGVVRTRGELSRGSADPVTAPLAHQTEARTREVDRRFKEAVVMLHAKQFDHAMTALHRVLELAPKMPEAHVNMGYAMLGLERFAAARDFFTGAIELRPAQANAYYGLALALEALNERAGALGAMRTYVHLAKPDDAHVRKARAALWEWQSVAKQDKPDAPPSPPPVGNVAQAKRDKSK